MAQATRWVFTAQVSLQSICNDPALDETGVPIPRDYDDIRGDLHCARGDIRYAIWQLELADSGQPHYQGYVEFTRSRRRAFCLGILEHAHWEIARADRTFNHDYCSKIDTRLDGPWEIGKFEPLKQGSRNDLLNVQASIKAGSSLRELADQHFPTFVRYDRGIQNARRLLRPRRDFQTELRVFYGPPGTGKSYFAHMLSNKTAYWLRRSPTGVWFDDYDGEDFLIIDEFDGWIPSGLLNQLADQYPLQVDTKHGASNFCTSSIIIISNYLPDMWYGWKFLFESLARRVTAWYHFTDVDHEYPPDIYGTYAEFKAAVTEHAQELLDSNMSDILNNQ